MKYANISWKAFHQSESGGGKRERGGIGEKGNYETKWTKFLMKLFNSFPNFFLSFASMNMKKLIFSHSYKKIQPLSHLLNCEV